MSNATNPSTLASSEDFRDLTEVLVALQLGLKYETVPCTVLSCLLRAQNRKPFSDGGKLRSYLRRAQAQGIVTLCEVKGKETTISLSSAPKPIEAIPDKGVLEKPKGDPSLLAPLTKVLMDLHETKRVSSFRIGEVSSKLHLETGLYYAGLLRKYLDNAQSAGLVKVIGEGNNTTVTLDPALISANKPSITNSTLLSPPSGVRAYSTLALPSVAVLGGLATCLARRGPPIQTFTIYPRMARYRALT